MAIGRPRYSRIPSGTPYRRHSSSRSERETSSRVTERFAARSGKRPLDAVHQVVEHSKNRLSAGFSARRGSRLVGAGIYTQVMTSSAEQAREPIGPPPAESPNGLSLVPPPAEPPSAPMREFLGWVVFRPRTHADVMDAWQSHCPRFTLWEDALGAGLVELEPGAAVLGSASVRLTACGRAALNVH